MKKLTIVLVFFMAACSPVKTAFDFDNTVDFTKFKTYAFSEESVSGVQLDQLNSNRIFRAFEKELAAKGFTKSDTPDVIVNLHLKTQQRTQAVANTTSTMGMGGMGMGGMGWGMGGMGGMGWGMGMGMSQTTINYNEYTDGTLFVTMYELSTKQLVWRGIGTKTLTEKMSPQKREQSINYAAERIMSQYPPVRKK
jgi:hypothetical protein